MTRQVVVTGIGLVTPLALTREASWQALLAGQSAAGKITQFNATGWPVDIACEVKEFSLSSKAIEHVDPDLLCRAHQFGMQAAYEAMVDAGLCEMPHDRRQHAGVIVGAGLGSWQPKDILAMLRHYDFSNGVNAILSYLEQQAPNKLIQQNHPLSLAQALRQRYELMGCCSAVVTACAAGAQAIGYGYHEILGGRANMMLVGGSDSLAGELLHAGFCLLGVLSKRCHEPTKASRPFDKARDGFVAGEGAAFMVLEDYNAAIKRGAHIYGQVLGYAATENAYRVTDIPEEGYAIQEAMKAAIANAGLQVSDIDLVNAHGTSTPLNDRIEAHAIKEVFLSTGQSPAITANKSSIGHFIAASGAVEAAFSILSIRDQVIPFILNLEDPCDPELDFVTTSERPAKIRHVLSNSFGFGGTNACLVFGGLH